MYLVLKYYKNNIYTILYKGNNLDIAIKKYGDNFDSVYFYDHHFDIKPPYTYIFNLAGMR